MQAISAPVLQLDIFLFIFCLNAFFLPAFKIPDIFKIETLKNKKI